MKYVHTNIISENWQTLAQFYIKVFDCQLVPPIRNQSGQWLDKITGIPQAHIRGAHLRLPGYGAAGPTLEIYSYNNMEEKPLTLPHRKGFGHIAFEVEDVAAILEKVLEHGGSKQGEISGQQVAGVGYITVIYVKDPEGNIIELQNWNLEKK
jgi:predicted enzyme related to lactoylglutathione lyase